MHFEATAKALCGRVSSVIFSSSKSKPSRPTERSARRTTATAGRPMKRKGSKDCTSSIDSKISCYHILNDYINYITYHILYQLSDYIIYNILIPVCALVFRVHLPLHRMVPQTLGPRHNVPPLGYSRLLAFHINSLQIPCNSTPLAKTTTPSTSLHTNPHTRRSDARAYIHRHHEIL